MKELKGQIRDVLIELGNIGIKGSLKPNDYYNGKIDIAMKDLLALFEKEMAKLRQEVKLL